MKQMIPRNAFAQFVIVLLLNRNSFFNYESVCKRFNTNLKISGGTFLLLGMLIILSSAQAQDTELDKIITEIPAFTFVKSANTNALSDPVRIGEVINYTFMLENRFNVTLSDAVMSDDLVDLTSITFDNSGSTTVSANEIVPGKVVVFRAFYAVKQTDIEFGKVVLLVKYFAGFNRKRSNCPF